VVLICPPALADGGATASVDLSATVIPPPCRVYTVGACNVGYDGAVLWGMLSCCHPPSPVTVSFGWDVVSHETDPAGYDNWTTGHRFFWDVFFQARLDGLEPDTTYYFRAKAQTGDYISYGEEMSFKTPPELLVKTLPADDIELNKATLNGKTVGWYGYPEVKVSFGWDTSSREGNPGGYAHWTPTRNARVGDSFSVKLTGLSPDTTYYFRARAERGGADFYGQELSFTTPPKHGGHWNWWDWVCGFW
jgi:phosphodiesterase/alkaline phosphatase D-like protein